MNGTELECDGSELRPDGTCARCERINMRLADLLENETNQDRRGALIDAIRLIDSDTTKAKKPPRSNQ